MHLYQATVLDETLSPYGCTFVTTPSGSWPGLAAASVFMAVKHSKDSLHCSLLQCAHLLIEPMPSLDDKDDNDADPVLG